MISEVLYDISTWSDEKVINFKRVVKPRLEHNFNTLKNIGLDPILTRIHDIVWNQK